MSIAASVRSALSLSHMLANAQMPGLFSLLNVMLLVINLTARAETNWASVERVTPTVLLSSSNAHMYISSEPWHRRLERIEEMQLQRLLGYTT